MHRQVLGRELGDQRVRTVRGDVQDDQLLLGGGPDATLAVLGGEAGDPGQLGAGGAADPQREADRVAAVDLLGQPACPRAPSYRSGAGPSGSGVSRKSFSSTSRNRSVPQSASRNFSRACCRDRR